MKVIWDVAAKNELIKIYNFIKVDSFQNAEMVIDGIIKATASLNKIFSIAETNTKKITRVLIEHLKFTVTGFLTG